MQGKIDELGLPQNGAVYVGLAHSLRPGQVNQIQLGPSHCLLASLEEEAQSRGTSQSMPKQTADKAEGACLEKGMRF